MKKQTSTFTSRFLKEYKSIHKSSGMSASIHLRTPDKVKSSWKPLNSQKEYGDKNYDTTLWLTGLLGMYGVDRFYLGFFWTGMFKLLTAGGFMALYIYDLQRVLDHKTLDGKGKRLRYERNLIGGIFAARALGAAQLLFYTPAVALIAFTVSYFSSTS